MSEELANKFIAALEKLEAEGETETISSLYAENAEIGSVVSPENFKGVEGAREFWSNYRKTLGEVRSTFRNQIITEKRAALEWKTKGTNAGGDKIDYEGVSILEAADGGEKIARFFAYFDPGKLGREIAEDNK